MKLSSAGILQRREWADHGYSLPIFDRKAAAAATDRAPTWIHFGAGNIFRAMLGPAQQKLLDTGRAETGLVAVAGREQVTGIYRPHDNLYCSVTLCADGSVRKQVVASVMETLVMDGEESDWKRLLTIFSAQSLQMVSLTITEKGYRTRGPDHEWLPDIKEDLVRTPEEANSYLGRLTALCYARYCAGALPFSLVSMDNCSHNGALLKEAITGIAQAWAERGTVPVGFSAYLLDPYRVGFPWTMIDKITPRPDDAIRKVLEEDGMSSSEHVVTSSGCHAAPFVNAEEFQLLVIEDWFPNGRPELEGDGFHFASRDVVERAERMKVCCCLNPLHTALAIYGCLLGYHRISDEMLDADLVSLVKRLGYDECLPVATDPGILHPKDFLDTVLRKRLPNPFLPDTPQRIAMDTSQKLSVRFGMVLKEYAEQDPDAIKKLRMIPLVFAGWCRYLLGIDDTGVRFEPSQDPLLSQLRLQLSSTALEANVHDCLRTILSNETVFGVNLYQIGMGETVEALFQRMLAGPGSVRRVLHSCVM